MKKKILQAQYKGELKIGDSIISCAVLEDGTRVISENGISNNFGDAGGKNFHLREKMKKDIGGPLPIFLASKALEPFVYKVFKLSDLEPIKYIIGDKPFLGYPADILPKVCEIWLMARENKTLQKSQIPKANKAEILMRGLAHIGITALVDEATGYQYDRDKKIILSASAKKLDDMVGKVVGYKVDPSNPLPNNTFKRGITYNYFFQLN